MSELIFSDIPAGANARVSICDADAPDNVLFDQALAPYSDRSVHLVGVGELVNQYLRTKERSFMRLKVSAAAASQSLSAVLYVAFCSLHANIGPEEFFAANWVSPVAARQVAPGALLPLGAVFRTPDSPAALLLESVEDATDGSFSTPQVSIPLAAVSQPACAALDSRRFPVDDETKALSIAYGDARASFFLNRNLRKCDCFYFRNPFNAVDLVAFHASVKPKQSVEGTKAVLNDVTLLCNRSVELEFEVQSGPLSRGELALAAWMLASHDVRIEAAGRPADDWADLCRILITESEISFNTVGDEPPSVKFSFRLRHNKLPLVVADNQNLFANPFNAVFA